MNRPQRSDLARHWTLDPGTVHLNHGSYGACPRAVLDEQARLRSQLEADPMAFYNDALPAAMARVRVALGQFVNADPEGLALLSNATTGVNTVLRSLDFEAGDEILVIDHAYQACRNAIDFVCSRTGAHAVVVPLPFPVQSEDELIAPLLAAVTAKTRLAMIDTVTSPTALRLPFERLTRELQGRGVDVLIDGAHGIGLLPLDLDALGAAYFVGNGHKWLYTPKGSGFLHVRSDRRERIGPLAISHGYSVPAPPPNRFRLQFDWLGTEDPTPWLCIPKAIEFVGGLHPDGWSGIRARNHALVVRAQDILAEALGIASRIPAGLLSAMAAFPIPVDATSTSQSVLDGDPLMRRLYAEHRIQVVVFAWPHHAARYLRVSAAPYNSEEEYRYLAQTLVAIGLSSR